MAALDLFAAARHSVRWCRLGFGVGLAFMAGLRAVGGEAWLQAGPLIQTFPLTLEPGTGTEAIGPLFQWQDAEDEVRWAVPPFVSSSASKDGDRKQLFVLPPVFTYRRYGEDVKWQLGQWFSGSRLDEIEDPDKKRFAIFPLFFYQDATDPAEDYWALVPFYGTLKRRLFRDEAEFVLFPLWLKTRKGTMTTRNVLFPLFHLRDGPGLHGWQFWPLVGHEHKEPGTRTNVAEEIEVVPGHDKTFALWPVFFRNRTGLGTDNPAKIDAALPFYYLERSPKRDHTTVLWPFVSWTDDREEKYRQWNAPWPLVGFARGEGKTLNRVIPFFSVGRKENLTTESYMWPLYRHRHLKTADFERERTQYAMFLYADVRERKAATEPWSRRIDSWPFFTWTRDPEGRERLQVFSILEPLRRGAGVERNWSPLWSVWRQERNAQTGASSQSLLWNLYRRDATPESATGSFLFGLVQYQRTPAGRRWRLLHMGPRLTPSRVSPEPETEPEPVLETAAQPAIATEAAIGTAAATATTPPASALVPRMQMSFVHGAR